MTAFNTINDTRLPSPTSNSPINLKIPDSSQSRSPLPPSSPLSPCTSANLSSSASSSSLSSSSDSDNDDDDSLVFFGQPTDAEREQRRKYEQHLRQRKLVRRDSLDLARRRTIVFVDGDQTDPELTVTIPPSSDQDILDSLTSSLASLSVLDAPSSDPILSQDMVPACQDSQATSTAEGKSDDDLLPKLEDSAPATLLASDSDLDSDVIEPPVADGVLDAAQNDEPSLLFPPVTGSANEEDYKDQRVEGIPQVEVSVEIDETQKEPTEQDESVLAETALITHESEATMVPNSETVTDEKTLSSALSTPTRPTKTAEPTETEPCSLEESLPSPGTPSASLSSVVTDPIAEASSILAEAILVPTEDENTTSPGSEVNSGETVVDSAPSTPAKQTMEPESLKDTSASPGTPSASMSGVNPTPTEEASVVLPETALIRTEREDTTAPESGACPDESVINSVPSTPAKMTMATETISLEASSALPGTPSTSTSGVFQIPSEEASLPIQEASVVPAETALGPSEKEDTDALHPEASPEESVINSIPSTPAKVTMATEPASLGEPSFFQQTSPAFRSCAVQTPNAEASILLNRSIVACTPGSVTSAHSFSMEVSPGLGRALVAPPSDFARRAIVSEALDSIYSSPLARNAGTDENAVRGSYIEMSSVDNRGRRRSARLSQGVFSPGKVLAEDDRLKQPARSSLSPEKNDRKVLGDIPGSQQQQGDLLESPSAEKLGRSKSRSRSVSPSKSRSPSKSKLDSRSSPERRSPLKSTGNTSPTVRSALNAWAGAKMVTPYSPEKRSLQQSTHHKPTSSPGLILFGDAHQTPSASSPVRLPQPANVERPGAALFSGSLRSPLKAAPTSSAPIPPTPVEGQTPALIGRPGAFSSPSLHSVAPITTAQPVPASPVRSDVPVQEELQGVPAVTAPATVPAMAAVQSSALNAPRIVRKLQPSVAPVTGRPNRLGPTTAAGIVRGVAPRKVASNGNLLASTRSAGDISVSSTASSSVGPSPIVRRTPAAPSALPRPVSSAVPSRLPKPATARSAQVSTTTASTSTTARLARPAATAARSAPAIANAAQRKPIAAASRPATLVSAGSKVAPRSQPLASGRQDASGARSAATNTVGSTSTINDSSATAAAAGAGGTSANANAHAPADTTGTTSSRNSAATSSSSTAAPTNRRLAGSTSGRTVMLRGTGGAVRNAAEARRIKEAEQASVAAAAPSVGSAASPQKGGSSVSMLERSMQMQARALARISPDSGHASARSEASPVRGEQYSPQAQHLATAPGSPGRISSPVKTVGAAGRLGSSVSSPVKGSMSLHRDSAHPPTALVSSAALRTGSGSVNGSAQRQPGQPSAHSPEPVATVSPVKSTTGVRRELVTSQAPASSIFGSQPRSTSKAEQAMVAADGTAPVECASEDGSKVATRTRAPRSAATRSGLADAEASVQDRLAREAEGGVLSPTMGMAPSSDNDRSMRRGRPQRSAAAAASSKIANTVSGGTTNAFSLTVSSGADRAPLLPISEKEMARLTAQNTRRNEVYLAKLDVRVERREGPRPPSPSLKTRDEAAAEARKNGRKRGSAIAQDSDEEEDDDEEALQRLNLHMLAKGDDERYATPPRLVTGKGVRWFKPLFVGPATATTEEAWEASADGEAKRQFKARKSCVPAKEHRLDRHGNLLESELKPLSPRMRKTKVLIKKIVYDDDEL